MPTGHTRRQAQQPEPRWLSSAQLSAWKSFTIMLARLPTALEVQLQSEARLSYVEYYVLAGLSDQPDRRMRMGRLAALTTAEPSRLSHMIRRLERRGLVRRELDPEDGRYTNAILTEAGHGLLVAAAPSHVAWVRELVMDHLDAAELRMLADVADRITARVEATKSSGCRPGADGERALDIAARRAQAPPSAGP